MPVAVQPGAFLPSASQCDSWWRMFAIGGFTATNLAGDKRWRTMPGEKVFSGCQGWYIRPVCCVKNSRIVSGVTGCYRHYPSSGTALYIDYSSVNQRFLAFRRSFSIISRVSAPSGRNGGHLLLTLGNSAETVHKTPLPRVMYLQQMPVLWVSLHSPW